MYESCQVEWSKKSSWRALDGDGGHGALRLRADTWLAETKDVLVGAVTSVKDQAVNQFCGKRISA